jgi:START domain-containing protein
VTFLSLLAVTQLLAGQDSPPWHPVGTTDGVQLEVRSVSGSSFEEIRATAVSPDRLDALCAAAFAKGRRQLDGRVKEKTFLRETDDEHWTYERIGIPVIADRDYVLHVKLEQPASTGRCEIPFESIEDPSRPKVSGVVRMSLHGRWTIVPSGDGKALVTYVVSSDPGGSVPALFAKNGQRQAAVELVKRILARAHASALPQ